MTPDTAGSDGLTRLEELFHLLAALPASERPAAATRLCPGEDALAEEALALLESSEAAEQLVAAGDAVRQQHNQAAHQAQAWIGKEIGPFRVDELIGRGGMGLVFRCHRSQEKQVGQAVALKISSQILRSETAIKQPLAERDTLGRLQHPHIARLLDAGIAGLDQPWMAMEFVEGRPLDVVCDDPATSSDDRFRLADQLCAALSYVHRNLVLHRDLKASNVMVTHEGNIKLLDFGIAKWTGPSAADSALTEAGLRPLTLQYASPERIKGEPLTTGADIYSAGLLLHRMFAGGLPDSGKKIRDLRPSIARDLEQIIGKCLRSDPELRYSTADDLASDLANARAGQPIKAYRGNWGYRTAKFVRRHRVSLFSAASVAVAISCGLLLIQRQASIEIAESHSAQQGLEREATLVHALLFDFFQQLKAIPGSTDAQRRTVTLALHYLDQLRSSPAGSASALEPDLIEAYTDFGNLLGSPYEENLGDAESAKRTLGKAIDVAQARVARQPNSLDAATELARAEMSLARVYFGAGDPQTAIHYMQPAADISDRVALDPRASSSQIAQAASTLDALADVEDLPGAASLDDRPRALAAIAKAEAYDRKGLWGWTRTAPTATVAS